MHDDNQRRSLKEVDLGSRYGNPYSDVMIVTNDEDEVDSFIQNIELTISRQPNVVSPDHENIVQEFARTMPNVVIMHGEETTERILGLFDIDAPMMAHSEVFSCGPTQFLSMYHWENLTVSKHVKNHA